MSDQKTLHSTIALDRLIHVIMVKKNKKGDKIKGLFIPIEKNLLDQDDYGIHLPIRIIYKPEEDDNKQNRVIAKTIGSKRYKEASKEQQEEWKDYDNQKTKEQTKILGNVKDWASGSNTNSGAASDEVLDEDDDLPF